MTNPNYDKEKLIEKAKSGKKLTREEDLFYLIHVLNMTEREAERIIAISENNDPCLIIG